MSMLWIVLQEIVSEVDCSYRKHRILFKSRSNLITWSISQSLDSTCV